MRKDDTEQRTKKWTLEAVAKRALKKRSKRGKKCAKKEPKRNQNTFGNHTTLIYLMSVQYRNIHFKNHST